MKSLTATLFGIIFILTSSFTTVVDGGISFEHSNYSAAKKLAKETNKTIFIDCYTQWCGPCKRMEAKVFSNPEVGAFFNKNFINVKMDMEKTDGMLIGRRYSVNFYPTLLFITPKGDLISKEVGYKTKGELLELARAVAN